MVGARRAKGCAWASRMVIAKTTTLVAGLRMTGMVAPMVLDGPINGDWFEAYVTQSAGARTQARRRGHSWTTCRSHKRVAVKGKGSKRPVPRCAPPALQPRLQSNREGVPPVSRPCCERLASATVRGLLGPDRKARRHLPTGRMRQFTSNLVDMNQSDRKNALGRRAAHCH